jgi:hypothetical protein
MSNRVLLIIAIVMGALALLVNGLYFVGARRVTTAVATPTPDVQAKVGICYTQGPGRDSIVQKANYVDCFVGGLEGVFWCEGTGVVRCYESPALEVEAEVPTSGTTQPTNQSLPSQQDQQPGTEPERPGGYLNDPFGAWSEPGYCLANDQRQFDIFEYEQAIDCIEKVPEGQACDYLNECFADQRSLVDYLQGFTQ